MRIALFTDTFRPTLNGVARTLGLLLEHANRRGHEVGLVTPHLAPEPWPDAAFHIRLPGVWLPFYRELKAARPHLGRTNRRLLDAFAPHVTHAATEAIVGLAGRRWALAGARPFVSSYCTNFADYMPNYRLGFLEGAAWTHLRRFHDRAALTFTPSEATLAELRSRGFHDRLRIWGRGVDSELFHPDRRSDALRASVAPGADVVLLYAGRIAPEKKVHLVLDAYERIRARTRRKVALVFVGGGPALDGLRARGVEDVHFAGYRTGEDLAAHYASADVFLFPSDTETFGQVVTEALSSGVPVVAPDRGGVTDTVIPGDTGFLFPPGDAEALADRALTLIEDDGLRSAMARRGRAAAESRSWDAVFLKLFEDYAEVAEEDTVTVTKPSRVRVPSPANFE